jgi:hypothetical protein
MDPCNVIVSFSIVLHKHAESMVKSVVDYAGAVLLPLVLFHPRTRSFDEFL